MDKNDQKADVSDKKLGLPSWVMNNIERLNFVSDFEQYACSPPETISYFAKDVESLNFSASSKPCDSSMTSGQPAEEKPKLTLETKSEKGVEKCSLVKNPSSFLPAVSIINSLKHEEFHSSPDSTPCATPEPSPVPRRKLSGQQDSVQSNPRGWFYLGTGKKRCVKGQCLNSSINKGSGGKDSKIDDSSINMKKDNIRLAISNFDLNAISPSSW